MLVLGADKNFAKLDSNFRKFKVHIQVEIKIIRISWWNKTARNASADLAIKDILNFLYFYTWNLWSCANYISFSEVQRYWINYKDIESTHRRWTVYYSGHLNHSFTINMVIVNQINLMVIILEIYLETSREEVVGADCWIMENI